MLLLFIALGACSPTGDSELAAQASPETPVLRDVVAMDGPLLEADLRGIAGQVQALPPEERALLRAAARRLVVQCPYTRSWVAVPLALQLQLATHAAGDCTPDEGRLLAEIQGTLAAHVAVLEAIGIADLPAPAAGDPLHALPRTLTPTTAELAHSYTPLADVQELVWRSTELVESSAPEVTAEIEANYVQAYELAPDALDMLEHLIGVRKELEKLQHVVGEPHLADDVHKSIGLIDDLLEQDC